VSARCSYCDAPSCHGSPVLGVWACAEHAADARAALTGAARLASLWSARQQERRLALEAARLEAARARHQREYARAGDALEAEAGG